MRSTVIRSVNSDLFSKKVQFKGIRSSQIIKKVQTLCYKCTFPNVVTTPCWTILCIIQVADWLQVNKENEQK